MLHVFCLGEAACQKTLTLCRGLPCGPDGFEYVVTEAAEPALYVIAKQTRGTVAAPSAAEPVRRLGILYVLDGAVYASPSLHAVLASRLVRRCLGEAASVADALPVPLRLRPALCLRTAAAPSGVWACGGERGTRATAAAACG